MNVPEEKKNGIGSVEEPEKLRTEEGEIEDESAETAAGGFHISQRPSPTPPGIP